jgi:hypothetical protein
MYKVVMYGGAEICSVSRQIAVANEAISFRVLCWGHYRSGQTGY